jgi:tol-pal system protein YbgF
MLRSFSARHLSRPGLAALVLAAALAGGALPTRAQDPADLLVRTTRLENQLRQMSGQIEQLQFENRRLTEQLRKFQEDVDFRLNEKGGGRAGTAAPAAPPAGAPPQQRPRRGDAFDPTMQHGAAGAPQPLGGGIAGIIEEEDAGGPATGQPLDLQGVGRSAPQGGLPQGGPRGPSVAAVSGPQSAREAYDLALAALQRKEYEQAEMGFRQFLQSYPRDRQAVEATYWLGESYLQRQRYREAAEQFLKITEKSPKAAKAPDSLLKLGMSLNGLGAREQACATYAKLGVDYPSASNAVRQGMVRERRRSGCA